MNTTYEFPKVDGRKLSGEIMEIIRRIAVQAVEEKGYSPEDITEIFGLSRSTIYIWLRNYRAEGIDGLKSHHPPGAKPVITEAMDDWLRSTVLHSTPDEHGYDTTLWTRDILADLLRDEFGIEVTGRAVSKHLKKIGLSYRKPEYQAIEQDPDEVEDFLQNKFPSIQKIADKIGADIFFEDEAGVGVQTHYGCTWGEKGKPPVVKSCSARGGFNVLSAVNASGEMYYSVTSERIGTKEYIDFLNQILRNRKRPVILIADNATFHKSKEFREFHRENRHRLKVFFLPKYSPKLNPSEQVWGEIKCNNIGKMRIKNKFDLEEKLHASLKSLQQNVYRITSFFRLPNTNYAAANV